MYIKTIYENNKILKMLNIHLNDIYLLTIGSIIIGYFITQSSSSRLSSFRKIDSKKKSKDSEDLKDPNTTENFANSLLIKSNRNTDDWIDAIPQTNKSVFLDIGIDEYLKDPLVGRIEIELFFEVVPLTCFNFYEICRLNKYKNCLVHRIIHDFMIQSGDITNNDGTGGLSIYGETFNDENFTLLHDKIGTVAMANSGTKIDPHSGESKGTNSSQFYITLKPTPHLNNKHVVFGNVTKGIEIVRELGMEMTDIEDKPTRKIYIIKSGIVD